MERGGWSQRGKRGRRNGEVGEDWTGSLMAQKVNRKPAQARVIFATVPWLRHHGLF